MESIYNYTSEHEELAISYPLFLNPRDKKNRRKFEFTINDRFEMIDELIYEGICIRKRKVLQHNQSIVHISLDLPVLVLQYDISKTQKLQSYPDHFYFYPGGIHEQLEIPEKKYKETLEILVSLDYIYKNFDKELKFVKAIEKAVKESTPIDFGTQIFHKILKLESFINTECDIKEENCEDLLNYVHQFLLESILDYENYTLNLPFLHTYN